MVNDPAQLLNLPRAGQVDIQVNLSAAINITAVSARRKLNVSGSNGICVNEEKNEKSG